MANDWHKTPLNVPSWLDAMQTIEEDEFVTEYL